MARGFATLRWLIHPIEPETFFSEYFEKKPLVIKREDREYYSKVLSMRELDRVLSTFALPHPDVRAARADGDPPVESYTFSDRLIDPARLYQQFEKGATIILNQLNRNLPQVLNLCRGLEKELSSRTQANIYLTPKDAQGFATHYDTHDVFIVQIHGHKHWSLYNTPTERPMPGQAYNRHRDPIGPKSLEFDLRPGDLAYVPSGLMHDATTSSVDSLHITVGLLRRMWIDVLLEAIGRMATTDVDFRLSLPTDFAQSDFDPTQAREVCRKLLARVVEKGDFDGALAHVADDFATTRYAILEGQLDHIRKLKDLVPEQRVGAYPNIFYRHRETDEGVVITTYSGDLRLPKHALEPAKFALENEDFVIRDLPGNLDAPGKVVLIRALIREGLVRIL